MCGGEPLSHRVQYFSVDPLRCAERGGFGVREERVGRRLERAVGLVERRALWIDRPQHLRIPKIQLCQVRAEWHVRLEEVQCQSGEESHHGRASGRLLDKTRLARRPLAIGAEPGCGLFEHSQHGDQRVLLFPALGRIGSDHRDLVLKQLSNRFTWHHVHLLFGLAPGTLPVP